MSRKVKEIKVTLGGKDDGLTEMFNQMLGTGAVNIHIAHPRYVTMRDLVEQLIKLFEVFGSSPMMESFPDASVELATFCRGAREQMAAAFSMNLSEYGWDLNAVEPELRKKFSDVYATMKKSPIVNTFIIMCDRLVPYKRHFANIDKLSYNFINNMSGVDWSPFQFVRLNLKHVMSLGLGEGANMFVMTVLNRAFTLSHSLYTEIQAPDIDVDQFVEFIMKNIEAVQRQPELARCDEAFKKIKESVTMLRERFNGYYRDFIDTEDNTIMMQHFILDVSKAGNASAKVAGQFRTIIGYYQKIANQQGGNTDPRMKSLFEHVNASFKDLDRKTENLVKIDEVDDDIPDSSPLVVSAQRREHAPK